MIFLGYKPNRWLVDKIILNATKLIHSQYELQRKDNIAEQLKDNQNRSVFEGSRLLLFNEINQPQNCKFIGIFKLN